MLYVSHSPEEGNMVIFHNTLLEEVGQWVIFQIWEKFSWVI